MKSIAWGIVVALVLATISAMTAVLTAQSPAATHHATIQQYCATCHNARLKTGGLSLDAADLTKVSGDAAMWEQVVRKLRVGGMAAFGVARAGRATVGRVAVGV